MPDDSSAGLCSREESISWKKMLFWFTGWAEHTRAASSGQQGRWRLSQLFPPLVTAMGYNIHRVAQSHPSSPPVLLLPWFTVAMGNRKASKIRPLWTQERAEIVTL